MTEAATNKKKTWEKPQMTVLTREHPEEAVLTGCKGSYDSSGDAGFNYACFYDNASSCDWCDAYAYS